MDSIPVANLMSVIINYHLEILPYKDRGARKNYLVNPG